jgi:hypothetical protein
VGGAGASQAQTIFERVGPRVNNPPQFEESVEIAVGFASEGSASDGRQYRFSDATDFRRVEQASGEEQTHLRVGAGLKEHVAAVERSLQSGNVGEGRPRPLVVAQRSGGVDELIRDGAHLGR